MNHNDREYLESLQVQADHMSLFQTDPSNEFIHINSRILKDSSSTQLGLPEFGTPCSVKP